MNSSVTIARPVEDPRVVEVLDRAGAALAGERRQVWSRFRALLPGIDGPAAPVLANVVALLTLDDDADLRVAADLAAELGPEGLARRQLQALVRLEVSPRRDLMTALCRRLWVGPADQTAPGNDLVASTCRMEAAMLLVEDVETTPPERSLRIRSCPEFEQLANGGSVQDWRPYVATIVASPWGPYADATLQFAREGDIPHGLDAIEHIVAAARARAESSERRQVAEQVRRLVHLTGLPQREFAALVGTSPSRLSTYVSGKVMPSAAMLVRITRTARSLERASHAGHALPRVSA